MKNTDVPHTHLLTITTLAKSEVHKYNIRKFGFYLRDFRLKQRCNEICAFLKCYAAKRRDLLGPPSEKTPSFTVYKLSKKFNVVHNPCADPCDLAV
jgi:hypothetical protein